MGNSLLKRYIRLAVREAHLARVPNQLVTADVEERSEDEAVDEFAGVGAGGVSGFTGPLGADPDSKGSKKRK